MDAKCFFHIFEVIVWFFSFRPLTWWITLICFKMLNQSCIPRVSRIGGGVSLFLYTVGFDLLGILICSLLYLQYLCLVLVSGWWWPHTMNLGVYMHRVEIIYDLSSYWILSGIISGNWLNLLEPIFSCLKSDFILILNSPTTALDTMQETVGHGGPGLV